MTDTEAFNLLAGEDTFNSLCCNNHGVTTLHIASGNGNTAIVKFLVNDCKVQPTCKCKDGTTPLHWASETGHLDIIEILASQMPANYLDQRDSSGRSALLYAAARGHLSVLQYFIEELNCDPFCQDHDGNTIVHYASLRGFTSIVQYLLTTISWSGVLRNKSGSTPLHLASWKGHLRIVQLLTDPAYQHTSTNTVPDLSGNTPLHIAASEGYKEIVSCLAGRKDFDVHCTTASGNTALHDACMKGHLDIVEFLVEHQNCNVLLANDIGATPLHLSVAFGHADIVQFLCSKQSYNQFCSTVYWTPLHMVCSSGLEESLALRIAQILLDQDSCDPSCTYNGVSPLHLASYSNNLNLVKLLVCERGCDPLKPDNNGKLALHYAVEGQNADVVDFFIKYEPESIMHEDHMGETPLRIATSENIVTKLLLNGADPNDIRVELSDKMSCLKNCVHLRGRSNVYIVGNHLSGKSTLVSALQSEHKGFFERFAKVTVSRDTTAGIKFSIYEESKCFGPVIFHDFAG
jgi:ankyrin repeat protein